MDPSPHARLNATLKAFKERRERGAGPTRKPRKSGRGNLSTSKTGSKADIFTAGLPESSAQAAPRNPGDKQVSDEMAAKVMKEAAEKGESSDHKCHLTPDMFHFWMLAGARKEASCKPSHQAIAFRTNYLRLEWDFLVAVVESDWTCDQRPKNFAKIRIRQSKLSQEELNQLQKDTHFDKKELQQWYKGQ